MTEHTSDNAKREIEIVGEWKKKSKHKGDSMAIRVMGWSGEGDYLESDWGMHKSDNE